MNAMFHEVTLDGRRRAVTLLRGKGGVWVSFEGTVRFVAEEGLAHAEGVSEDNVIAPMTGTIVEVTCKPGDKVSEGDVLVSMEAMKMEYRLAAPRDGVVQSVASRAGDLVDLGTVLVSLE